MSLPKHRKAPKVTPAPSQRQPGFASSFTDQQKAMLVLRSQEEKFRRTDRDDVSMTGIGERARTPIMLTGRVVGLGRTKLSLVLNGREQISSRKHAAALDAAVRKVIAEPGPPEYQALWAKVFGLMEQGRPGQEALCFVVPTAYHAWSAIALDPAETVARRLLYGRMAQYVLYRFVHVLKPRSDITLAGITIEEAADLGRRVIDVVARIVAENARPPAAFFEEGTPEARACGFRMFRIRMLAARVGWFGGRLSDDAERARVLTEAFKSGIADDLMWIHEMIGLTEVAHPNNAFNLAVHAGEWRRAAEYGCALLVAFPDLLTSSVGGLKPICEDYTVFPGVAAMLADQTLAMPPAVRELLTERNEKTSAMMPAVEKMIAGGLKNKTYLEMLSLGALS